MLLGCEQTKRRQQRQQQRQDWIPFDLIIHDDAPPDAWKMEGGVNFGASQCFPMDLAAAARCVHSFT